MSFGRNENYSVTGKALMRMTREMTLEEQGENCKKMEKGMNFMDGVLGIAGLALGVAALFTMPLLITVSTAILVNVMVARTIIADESVEKACADLPFLELDEKMKARQEESDKKLAEQTEILKEVNKKISETLDRISDLKSDMNQGFQSVLNKVGDLDASNPASDIKTAVDSLEINEENKRMATPERYVYIIQQEVAKKSDSSLYNYIGMQGSLYKAINAVINKKNSLKPSISLPALNAGITNYASTVITLIHELRYISEHSYQKGDLKKFNNFFNRLVFDFNYFKLILNGSSRKKGMIDNVIDTLNNVKKSKSKQEIGNELYDNIGKQVASLGQLKQKIAGLSLDVIESTPDNAIDIDFNSRTGDQRSSTNFLDWKEGAKVSYAVQFEKDGKYSKVSEWTKPQDIMKIANPDIEFRKPSNMNRLVFRKFGDGIAELAYVLSGSESKFRDVHRDLYNLASKNSMDDGEVTNSMNRLIKHGAKANAVFEGKRTVIHAAAYHGRTGMLGKILEKDGSLINKGDLNDYTPLHIAAEQKKTAFAKELIKRGANVNAIGKEYKVTPLHLAIRYHAGEIVDALLGNAKINPNLKDVAGLSPLHYAITDENYNKELFTKLVSKNKVNLNLKDNNGLGVLHYATILNRWEEVIDLSFEGKRTDMYLKDNKQMLALHYDAMKGNKMDQLMSTLMADNKGEVLNDAAGDKKWTPLHYAAFFKQTRWLDYVFHWHNNLVSKINVNAKDVDDQTPLHLAAQSGVQESVKILLDNGAHVYAKNKKQYTPLDVAIMSGKKDVIDDLLTFESKQKVNGKPAKDADTKACGLAKGDMLDLLKKKKRCGGYRRAVDEKQTEYSFKIVNNGMFEDNSLKPMLTSYKSDENLKLKDSKALEHADVNGALLLLDVFIRKMTNKNYNSALGDSKSLLDARAQALNITDNLQKILELSGNNQGDNDLLDIHSKIYKAIMSGNDYKLVKEVCTYLNEYSTLEPQKIENFISVMLPSEPVMSPKKVIHSNLENLVAHTCYQTQF